MNLPKKNKNNSDITLGISISSIVAFVAVVISILHLPSDGNQFKFYLVNHEGDISTSFSTILGIISTVMAVFFSLHIYKKQKTDTEISEKKKEYGEKLAKNKDQLETVIKPLLENSLILRDQFEIFRKSLGPYLFDYLKKKESCLAQIERITERYIHSSEPEFSFIVSIDNLRKIAITQPVAVFDQFNTDEVKITDNTKCQTIYDEFKKIIEVLENKRSILEGNIGVYSEYLESR